MLSLRIGRAISTLFLLSLGPAALAQMRHTPAAKDPHFHIYAIVPLVGTGTELDPKRPMFVPATGLPVSLPVIETAANPVAVRTGILAYNAQITDDGLGAIVEIVAATRGDLVPILSSLDTRVKVFQKGLDSISEMEAAFVARKKDFSFNTFRISGVH